MELELALPGMTSLKDKRRIVKSVVEGLAPRFGCAAAETGAQDLWQRAELGVALVGGTPSEVRQRSGRFLEALRGRPELVVTAVHQLETAPER